MKDGQWDKKERQRSEEQRGVDVSLSSSWLLTVAMWNSDWLWVLWEGGPNHLQQGEIQQQGLWPHFCTGSVLYLHVYLPERKREEFFFFISFISSIIGNIVHMYIYMQRTPWFYNLALPVKQINWISSVVCVTDRWLSLRWTQLHSEDQPLLVFVFNQRTPCSILFINWWNSYNLINERDDSPIGLPFITYLDWNLLSFIQRRFMATCSPADIFISQFF